MSRADAIGYDLIAAALLKAVVFPICAIIAGLYLMTILYLRFGKGIMFTSRRRRLMILSIIFLVLYAVFEFIT